MSKELPLFKKISGGYKPHKIQFWIIKQINYTHIFIHVVTNTLNSSLKPRIMLFWVL